MNSANSAKLWNYATGGAVKSCPTVVGGVVYVWFDDGNVYALNAANGAKLWNYTTVNGSSISNYKILSSPAVIGSVVYIGSYNYNVYALKATNGAKLWNYKTSGEVDSSPAVVNGVVYIGCYGPTATEPSTVSNNGNVFALNATDGDQLWDYPTSYVVSSSPAVVDGVLYVGGGNIVYALGSPMPSPSPTSVNTYVERNVASRNHPLQGSGKQNTNLMTAVKKPFLS